MAKTSKLRIIGGQWRRHLLPIAAVEGLRPTPDRVRETLFNWLGQTCDGWQVLDLYSGTGALGLEAASRGASGVTCVEAHAVIAKQLRVNAANLLAKVASPPSITIKHAPVEAVLKALQPQAYDVVFLDPPFGTDVLPKVLPTVATLVKPDGVIYIEWGRNLFENPNELAKWLNVREIDELRYLKAGQVHAHLVALPGM